MAFQKWSHDGKAIALSFPLFYSLQIDPSSTNEPANTKYDSVVKMPLKSHTSSLISWVVLHAFTWHPSFVYACHSKPCPNTSPWSATPPVGNRAHSPRATEIYSFDNTAFLLTLYSSSPPVGLNQACLHVMGHVIALHTTRLLSDQIGSLFSPRDHWFLLRTIDGREPLSLASPRIAKPYKTSLRASARPQERARGAKLQRPGNYSSSLPTELVALITSADLFV